MANQPLFLAVQNEFWYPSIKTVLNDNEIAVENRIEIGHARDWSIVSNKPVPADNNRHVWLFGHGWSRPRAVGLERFGIFATFDASQGKGHLFDTSALLAFLCALNVDRLYLFACYQGKYLVEYLDNMFRIGGSRPSFITGFDSSANRSAAPDFLKGYFKDPSGYKMDRTASA